MDVFIAALWELRTWFALLIGVTIGLTIAALLTMSKRHDEPEGPSTILILPPDEPMEQVDIKGFARRWS